MSSTIAFCPICSQKINCYISLKFDHQESELNQKLEQILSSQFIIFDPLEEPEREHDSSFISFFKHLVGSKGLDALANPLKEEGLKQMEKKTDDFLIHFLQEMFASA